MCRLLTGGYYAFHSLPGTARGDRNGHETGQEGGSAASFVDVGMVGCLRGMFDAVLFYQIMFLV